MKTLRQSILGLMLAGPVLFSSALVADPGAARPAGNPIEELEAEMAALAARLAELETDFEAVAALQTRVAELKTTNAELQARLACVSGTSNAWDLFLEGCNVHVRDASGGTDSTSGQGNLIIGYDEGFGGKSGTHNLVVGPNHTYTSWGGVLFGQRNAVTAPAASALAGERLEVNEEGAWAAGSVAEDGFEQLTVEVQQFTANIEQTFALDARNIESTAQLQHTLKSGFSLDMQSAGSVALKSSGGPMLVEGAGVTQIRGASVKLNDGSKSAARRGDLVSVASHDVGAPSTGTIQGGSSTVFID
jgi:outer membrane murein-binding lipoprotein Lpp